MVAGLAMATVALAAVTPVGFPSPAGAQTVGWSEDAARESPAAESGDRGQPARATVIRDVRIFDGRETRGPTTVVVRGDSIAAVGPDARYDGDARVVEGDGRTLLPGLIDAHTHTFDASMLRASAVFGVTTVLDMFTEPSLVRRWQEEQQGDGARGRADIYSSGILATAPGGHGTQFGLDIPTIEGPKKAEEFVEARIDEGSDYIKIVYDDGALYGLDFPTIDEATLDALVRAAHEYDHMTVVHVSTVAAARDAVDAGADGLAHVWSDSVPDPDLVERMAEGDLFVVPTLSVIQSTTGSPGGAPLLEDDRITPYLSAAEEGQLSQGFEARPDSRVSFDAARNSVGSLFEAGVPILAGTDAPNPGTAHGASVHRELEHLVQAGLPPAAALRAATSVPARIFGLDGRGRIEPGLRADLLLVEGDPTKEITRTRDIVAVWKSGARLDRNAYRDELGLQGAGGASPPTPPRPAPAR